MKKGGMMIKHFCDICEKEFDDDYLLTMRIQFSVGWKMKEFYKKLKNKDQIDICCSCFRKIDRVVDFKRIGD